MPLKESRIFEEHEPFFLAVSDHAVASRQQNGTIFYTVWLNPSHTMDYLLDNGRAYGNPYLEALRRGQNPSADFFAFQLKKLESDSSHDQVVSIATPEHPIRWSSAGGLIILEDTQGHRFVPMTVRSPLGYYPGMLDEIAGMSNKAAEWLIPEMLGLREILEEFIIVNDSHLVIPSPKLSPNIADRNHFDHIQSRSTMLLQSLTIRLDEEPFYADLVDITPEPTDALTIHCKGVPFTSSGIIIADPKTAALEFRKVYKLNIGNIDNVSLIDGEAENGSQTRSKDRTVLLFNESDIRAYAYDEHFPLRPIAEYRGGKKGSVEKMFEKNIPEMTPALKKTIQSLYREDMPIAI